MVYHNRNSVKEIYLQICSFFTAWTKQWDFLQLIPLGNRGVSGKKTKQSRILLCLITPYCSSLPLLSTSPPWMTLATKMSPVISWRLMVAPWREKIQWGLLFYWAWQFPGGFPWSIKLRPFRQEHLHQPGRKVSLRILQTVSHTRPSKR